MTRYQKKKQEEKKKQDQLRYEERDGAPFVATLEVGDLIACVLVTALRAVSRLGISSYKN